MSLSSYHATLLHPPPVIPLSCHAIVLTKSSSHRSTIENGNGRKTTKPPPHYYHTSPILPYPHKSDGGYHIYDLPSRTQWARMQRLISAGRIRTRMNTGHGKGVLGHFEPENTMDTCSGGRHHLRHLGRTSKASDGFVRESKNAPARSPAVGQDLCSCGYLHVRRTWSL